MGWLNGQVDPTDPKLRNFRLLATTPIEDFVGRGSRVRLITFTTLQRLAHLTERMERMPCDQTATAARWYSDHIVEIPLPPEARAPVAELRERLIEAVQAYENRVFRRADPDNFGRLVGATDRDRAAILYGPPTTDTNGQSFGSQPQRYLATYIQLYCWKCSLWG
jgi:hypothetical protein